MRKRDGPAKRGKNVDDAELTRLWMAGVSEKEMAARLGHHRSVIRRRAAAIGMPPLQIVRARMAHELKAKHACNLLPSKS